MTISEFSFEFYSEVPDPGDALRMEAEDRLVALTKGRDDLRGAAVNIEELSGSTTPYLYQTTVVVYKRPTDVAATEKAETVEAALKGALNAVERQIRELRYRLDEAW
jgi:ribosome-associated translation inhibitor RaiA